MSDFYIYTVQYVGSDIQEEYSDLSHALESLGFDETPDVNESDLPKALGDVVFYHYMHGRACTRTAIVDKREPEDDEEERRLALALLLDVANMDDVTSATYGDGFEYEGAEYLVLTDEEADEAFSEAVESYVDDCMDIPSNIRPYFDMEAFKNDVEATDGRGRFLASYDGEERQFGRFFIYRTN